MADSISIVMKMQDDISGKLKSIASTSKGCTKEFEELQRKAADLGKRYESFNKQSAGLSAEALKVKAAMNDAKKAFAKTQSEADRANYEKLTTQYNELTAASKGYAQAAKDTVKEMNAVSETARKLGDRPAGSGSGSGGFLSAVFGEGLGGGLAASGVLREIGSSLTGLASGMLESAVGQPMATLLDSTLSSAFSGAAAGAIAGVPGMVAGAIGGGLAGMLGGGTQIYEQRDDAFKSYVQAAAEEALETRESDITSGSTVAAQREMDAIAFNTMLGEGTGDQYLSDLRVMAARTPMEYSDLTAMSRSLATGFRDDPGRMLSLMTSIGNAGSAVGADASGMNTMATAMARMQSSGKVSLEYLNLIQERGVDAVGMLADGLDVSKAKIYDMISGGEIDGVNAVNILQAAMDKLYDGAMEKQAQTFSGLTSTLADAETEMQNAYGEGFNETRKQGLQDQINYLSGESGAAMQEANKAIGAWYASLENEKESFIRKAQEEVLNSDEYKTAMAEGTDEGYAEAGRLLMEAKVRGMNEYNASDGAQLALESEMALAGAIRDDTATNSAFYDAGLKKANAFSKGLASGIQVNNPLMNGGIYNPVSGEWEYVSEGNSNAFGLRYVPYDGYPALLHQGERVLTAAEARGERSAAAPIQITITGNSVRSDEDIDEIVRKVTDGLRSALDVRG